MKFITIFIFAATALTAVAPRPIANDSAIGDANVIVGGSNSSIDSMEAVKPPIDSTEALDPPIDPGEALENPMDSGEALDSAGQKKKNGGKKKAGGKYGDPCELPTQCRSGKCGWCDLNVDWSKCCR